MESPIGGKVIAVTTSWNPGTIASCYLQYIGRERDFNLSNFAGYYTQQVKELWSGKIGNPAENIGAIISGSGEVITGTSKAVKNALTSPFVLLSGAVFVVLAYQYVKSR